MKCDSITRRRAPPPARSRRSSASFCLQRFSRSARARRAMPSTDNFRMSTTTVTEHAPSRATRATSIYAALLMCLATIVVYIPLGGEPGAFLLGIDYRDLHMRRMRYAQEALFGEGHRAYLPAWHTREFLGSPFWSNVQNFPWIP